ncbi:hypothetical protein NH288_05080 [Anaerococcus sp. NML200537]|uniref:hypothetical protein n=1 Tax=Anaerococcus sp. NML200537 TaxID=2954485 RepID=UPI00223788CB|nr:hypothetical protein [Anaerococcus sp. NML200537]MCW6701457.1 hypothetical protein [Anaerococcus sp. NML200537]
MNLWEETLNDLKENSSSWEYVNFISCDGFRITKDNFKDIAVNTDYNNGYGRQEIASNLKLYGNDFVMIRLEYEGSEWWEYIPTKPDKNLEIKTISRLIYDYYHKSLE